VAAGRYDDQFPVDVFQTGSGTSSNMNANEVDGGARGACARRAVHPKTNEHEPEQNDVVPTAIHVSAALRLHTQLRPALKRLQECWLRARGFAGTSRPAART